MKRVVLFIIDTLQTGGAEKSLLEITAKFRNYHPVFFQLYPGNALHADFAKANIEVREFNLKPGYHFKANAQQVLPDALSLRPVLIHSSLFRSDMVARHLSAELGVPLVNSLVNNSYSKKRYAALSAVGKLKLLGIQLWDRLTAPHVDLFISNSFAIKETNAKALGISSKKIEVIYRGRDSRLFSSVDAAETTALKTSMNVGSKKVFLNVSRLLDRKGQLDLIRAFDQVHKQRQDVMLLIAGDGAYRNILESEVTKLGLIDSILLLGNRKDVPALLKAADFFVFPSHYEGLPGALIEAMFARTPVIVSAIPENLECVDEQSALLFPAGDQDQLAAQMIRALEDTGNAVRAKRAYEHALANFEINQIATRYETAYDGLLRDKSDRSTRKSDGK